MERWRTVRACQKVTSWQDVAKCYLGELMTNAKNWHLTSNEPVGPRLLRGANVNRYVLLPEPKQGQPLYLREADFLREFANDRRVSHHNSARVGFQESSPIDNSRRLIAAVIPAGQYCVHKIRYFIDEANYDIYTILVLFNSSLSEWRFGLTSTNNSVNEYEVNVLPIPRFDRIERSNGAVQESDEDRWQSLLTFDQADSVVSWETEVLKEIGSTSTTSNAWPNSIHDALAASGKELTRLRELRQTLIEDFATWLFTTCGIDRDRFTGRTRLQGGQADMDQQDWEWLTQLLRRNRSACAVDPFSIETQIRERFNDLLTQTRRCNSKFKALDAATDRIIWQLVGLNPDGSVPQMETVRENAS